MFALLLLLLFVPIGGIPLFGVVLSQSPSDPHAVACTQSASLPSPLPANALAWGSYDDDVYLSTGWGLLEVRTGAPSASSSSLALAFAAGYLESCLTANRSQQFIANAFVNQTYGPDLTAYIDAQFKYIHASVVANPADAYWVHVGLVFEQWEGLFAGYNAWAPPGGALSYLSFYSSTFQGDLDDLDTVFSLRRGEERAGAAVKSDGHCSVLIKAVGGGAGGGHPSELLVAHTTWGRFETMTRMMKLYDFPWSVSGAPGGATVAATAISFSSYPASLFSDDDYYVTFPSNLVVSETTISNNNASLWAYVVPTTVPEWARNMVANRLATDGPSWAALFARENSGTYNNMWHVVDYKLFVSGQPLADDLLWVLTQLPGPFGVASDHTGFLRNASYWASYNRIADPALFALAGQWSLVEKYGPHFSYNETSRARIFAARQDSVVDEASLQALIRYNDFENDPLGVQGCANGVASGSNAISERGDLTPQGAQCVPGVGFQDEAGIDAKYTTSARVQQGRLSSMVQSGPTHDTQPPFVWSASPLAWLPHEGMPDVWNFTWVEVAWDV